MSSNVKLFYWESVCLKMTWGKATRVYINRQWDNRNGFF